MWWSSAPALDAAPQRYASQLSPRPNRRGLLLLWRLNSRPATRLDTFFLRDHVFVISP
jgi:hypothetical protein